MRTRRALNVAKPANGIVLSEANGGLTGVIRSWQYSTSTTAADPGDGYFRFNHADPESGDTLYISDLDGQDGDLGPLLAGLGVGTRLLIKSANAPAQFIMLVVTSNTDNSGWHSFGYTFVAGAPDFLADETCAFEIGFTGVGREVLAANRTYYLREDLGEVSISNASPAVASLAGHGLAEGDRVVFSDLPERATCTITIANPGVVTRTAHGYAAGQPIVFSTTDGDLPTGITAGITYYVLASGLTTDTFQFASTVGGAAIETTGSQTGTHYVARAATLPTGVTAGTAYYVIATGLTTDEFQFSASEGGAAINTSGDQAGIINAATGSDSNDGLSSGASFLTLNGVWGAIAALDLSIYAITVQLADGIYATLSINKAPVGGLSITLQGNSTYPDNVRLSGTNTINSTVPCTAPITLKDMRGAATGGSCIRLASPVSIYLNNFIFGSAAQRHAHILSPGAYLRASGNYFIDGGAQRHLYCVNGGQVEISGRTIVMTGSPAFSQQTVNAEYLSILTHYGCTFVGVATGTRYSVDVFSVIFTNGGGASYFPGNASGSVGTTGKYV